MEGHDDDHSLEINVMSGGGSGGHGAARWNPTKEQIDILEGLYTQGLRTPSAHDIQQITGRLREYGHIEGKNVFYWFQNHKARQRQKQKQSRQIESAAFANRFILPKPPSMINPVHYHHQPSSHCPAGVCMAYPDIGMYNQQQQQQRMLLQRPVKRRPPPLMPAPAAGGPPVMFQPPYSGGRKNYYYNDSLVFSPGRGSGESSKETLELFPTQPSGNLLSPNSSSGSMLDMSLGNFPAGSKRQIHGIPAAGGGGGGGDGRAFFDFLRGKNGSSCDR